MTNDEIPTSQPPDPANGKPQNAAEALNEMAELSAEAGAAVQGHALPKPKIGKRHKARIEHKIPGRIRMKVPHGKSNPEILKAYSAAFSALPGITKVEARTDTGSIVILYDPRFEADFHHHLNHACDEHDTHVQHERPGDEMNSIASKIENEAEFLAQHSALARVTVDFFKNFDRELKSLTDNTVDMKILLAGGLAAFTFLEIGAEAATPMWVTLVLFSLNHLTELHAPHHSAPAVQSSSTR